MIRTYEDKIRFEDFHTKLKDSDGARHWKKRNQKVQAAWTSPGRSNNRHITISFVYKQFSTFHYDNIAVQL